MPNSITTHVKGVHAANGIRMLRGGNKDIVFLVEGGADRSILWAVFGVNESRVYIANGKENLDDARANLLKHPEDGCIVIRDRDFDTLVLDPAETYVLITDDYDLECGFLRNGCLEKLIGGFAIQKRVNEHCKDIRTAAFEVAARAASYGAALRHFQTLGIPAKFEGLSCGHIDRATFTEDVTALLAEICNKSVACRAAAEAAKAEVIEEVQKAAKNAEYPWHFARSCDVYEVLSHALRKRLADLSGTESSPLTLQRALTAVAHMSHITGTKFYHKLHQVIHSMAGFQFGGQPLLKPT